MRREWKSVDGPPMPAISTSGVLNTDAPSTKNGRRSRKKLSNTLRFRTAGSASTCPKSGLIVALSDTPDDSP